MLGRDRFLSKQFVGTADDVWQGADKPVFVGGFDGLYSIIAVDELARLVAGGLPIDRVSDDAFARSPVEALHRAVLTVANRLLFSTVPWMATGGSI